MRQGFFGHANGAGLLILGGWWTFAFFVSVYGLVAESGTGDHQEPTSPDHQEGVTPRNGQNCTLRGLA
jgi:hypothetical protein